jgi:hypothetical protein
MRTPKAQWSISVPVLCPPNSRPSDLEGGHRNTISDDRSVGVLEFKRGRWILGMAGGFLASNYMTVSPIVSNEGTT